MRTIDKTLEAHPASGAAVTLWLAGTAICGGLAGMVGFFLGRLL